MVQVTCPSFRRARVVGVGRRLVGAMSLDETLFMGADRWRIQCWSTQLVDACNGQCSRSSRAVTPRLQPPGSTIRTLLVGGIRWAVTDLLGPCRAIFDTVLPGAEPVAGRWRVGKLADVNCLRGGAQNAALVPRGRMAAPVYRRRRLVLAAGDRLGPRGTSKLTKLLRTVTPTARSSTPGTPMRLSASSTTSQVRTPSCRARQRPPGRRLPARGRSLGCTFTRRRTQIVNGTGPRLRRPSGGHQQPGQARGAFGSDRFRTTESGRFSTQADPTGPPRHHHTR